MYTNAIVDNEEHCMSIMTRMEEEFVKKNEQFFVKVLKEESSLVLRVHAVTILADLGSEDSVPTLSDVLHHDPDPLVRHEAAFSLGQMGLASAVPALEKAVLDDPEGIVRHESAAALGSIGSQAARATLQVGLNDPDAIVRNSAKASLFNLTFLERFSVRQTARERMPRP